MKKVLLMAVALFSMVMVQAQNKDDIAKSQDYVAKLQTLCNQYPGQSGNAVVDEYGKALYDAAKAAITSGEELNKLLAGVEAAKTAGGDKKDAAIEAWSNYGIGLASDGVDIQQAIAKAQAAVAQTKNDKVNAVIEFGNKVTPLLIEGGETKAKIVRDAIRSLYGK